MSQPALPGADRQRCVDVTRGGSRCTRWAYSDTDRCRQHGQLVKARTPTGLSDDDQARLFAALEDGLALDQAVVDAGVARSTVYDWLIKAKEAGSAPEYAAFAAGIERARTKLERTTLKNMAIAARKGNFNAQKRLLELVNPERYGRRPSLPVGQLELGTTPKRRRPAGDDDQSNVVELRPGVGSNGADW